jgi:hypothetical protein
VPGDLIVEHLEGETLVYDKASDQAHVLSGDLATEFSAALDEVSRRQVLRKLALAGAAAAGAGTLAKTIVAPTAAQAQSTCNPACGPTSGCCLPHNACCDVISAQICCQAGAATACCPQLTVCCPSGSANACALFNPGACNVNGNCCSNLCCGGVCCTGGVACVNGLCP